MSGIEEALNVDRRKTIDELADNFDVSHRTVYYIITNELKVSARWVPVFWVHKTSQCAFKRRNVFSNATHGKASVSCRAALRVINHGSISMIRRQKSSQWCGNIHHHLHQGRQVCSQSDVPVFCRPPWDHYVACRPKSSDDQRNMLPEGTL